MRLPLAPILAAVLALSLCGVASADSGPVIVVPGRPDVPVVIDGVEVSGAVVYGDWGLARPRHGAIVIDGPIAYASPWVTGAYYPSAGRAPRYGRHEIEPAQRRPRPATEFTRSRSTESDRTLPVTEYPPFNPPPVIMAPRQPRAPSGHR